MLAIGIVQYCHLDQLNNTQLQTKIEATKEHPVVKVAFMQVRENEDNEDIREAFRVFDRDGDG